MDKISAWTDLKKFDNVDLKPGYFEEENAQLVERFGPYVTIGYISTGRIGYNCDLCEAEMNGEPSLDSHCNGMKHLKKKDKWEKQQQGFNEEEFLNTYINKPKKRGGGWGAEEDADDVTPPLLALPGPSRGFEDDRPYEANPPGRPYDRPPGRPYDRPPSQPQDRWSEDRAALPPPKCVVPSENMTAAEKLVWRLDQCVILDGEDAQKTLDLLCNFSKIQMDYYKSTGQRDKADDYLNIQMKCATLKAHASLLPDSPFAYTKK